MWTTEDHTVAAGHSVTPTSWQVGLEELLGRVVGRFGRVEPRRRARGFVLGLLADLPRKNCWTIAEHAGDATPDGMQHLLAGAVWDHDAVRDDVRDDLVDHLGDPAAVLVVDQTGDLKKGASTVGVQRQYTGTAGKVDNAQVAVYLAYATTAGHGVIDRELYLPRGWLADPERCHAAGVPTPRALPPSRSWPGCCWNARGRPGAGRLGDRRCGLRRRPGAARLAGGPPAALCAGGQAHRAAAGAVRSVHAGGPAGRAHPAGVLAAHQRWPGCQGSPLVWVESGGAGHRRRAGGVAALAAGSPQPSHRGVGVLRVRRPSQPAADRPGPGRRVSLAGGGGVPSRQGAVRPGPAPGPPLALLVPLGDPGHAGLRVPSGGRGHRARPPPTTIRAHPVDLQRDPAPVRRPRRRTGR